VENNFQIGCYNGKKLPIWRKQIVLVEKKENGSESFSNCVP